MNKWKILVVIIIIIIVLSLMATVRWLISEKDEDNGDDKKEEPKFETYSGTYTLAEAIDSDKISVEISGTGYSSGQSMRIKINSNLNMIINITLKPGIVLANSGSGQNMITAESKTIKVKPKIEVDIEIEAYCLDAHKDNPSSSETFSIQADSGKYGEDAIKLLQSLEDVSDYKKSVIAIQIALWVITDDISREDIAFDFSEEDINDAKWLLENVEIDISNKKLFNNDS